jgi:hypothetical protein
MNINMLSRAVFAAACVALALTATALNRSWTGDDLYDAKQITFPTTEPALDGESLVFGPGAEPNGKLIQFALKGGNPNKGLLITVNATLTRLSADWDPYLVVGDGSRWVGVAIFDPSSGASATGGMARMEGVDLGDRGLPDYYTGSVVVVAQGGFPAVGGSVDVTLEFLLTDYSTTVSGYMLGGAGSYVAPALNRESGISVILMRDNEPNESYAVEAMSVSTRVAR